MSLKKLLSFWKKTSAFFSTVSLPVARAIKPGFALLFLVGLPCCVFASAITVTDLETNLGKTVTELSVILSNISLIAGIGFVLASFFKFHQHKMNPTQVPLSQGITLLLIGAALLLFPRLLPTAAKAAFGTTKITSTQGSEIKGLIGGSGGGSGS
jgi:intracellular multiplication protein IcmD